MTARPPYLGFALYFATRLWEDRPRLARVVDLLVDDRWPWRPVWGSFSTSGYPTPPRRRYGGARGREQLVKHLADPNLWAVTLLTSVKEERNHASVTLRSGPTHARAQAALPFEVHGQIRGFDLPARRTVGEWLALVHDLAREVEARCGIVCAWDHPDAVLTDVGGNWIARGVPPPFDAERERVRLARDELGARWVRPPRWGTYVHETHADAVGGVSAIERAIAPGTVARVGSLVYAQLSADPADALSPGCETRRARLEALLAPITPPPAASP